VWPTGGDWQDVFVRDAYTREPAALAAGPRDGFWYWRDDLQTQQDIGHRMARRGQPLSSYCRYHLTERWVEHRDPTCRGVFGRVWEWQPPAADTAPLTPPLPRDPEVCAKCAQAPVGSGAVLCPGCRAGMERAGGWGTR